MLSSGTSATSTSNNDPVTLITVPTAPVVGMLSIVNTGSVAGFISTDGGTTWAYLPAGPSSRAWAHPIRITGDIKLKRIADGSNVTGVFADLHRAVGPWGV